MQIKKYITIPNVSFFVVLLLVIWGVYSVYYIIKKSHNTKESIYHVECYSGGVRVYENDVTYGSGFAWGNVSTVYEAKTRKQILLPQKDCILTLISE